MKKIDYKHGKFTLLTTEIDTDAYSREDYEEWCEMNGIEPTDNEDDFFDYCAEETRDNYESDMDNIESCREYKVPVVVTGTLGLWNGRRKIMPERFESVGDAISQCISRSDSISMYAEYNDGRILVDCYHHDGCNRFSIRALSKKGVAKQYAEYKEHDFKRLPYLYAI